MSRGYVDCLTIKLENLFIFISPDLFPDLSLHIQCPENGYSLENVIRFPERSNIRPSDNEPLVRSGPDS